MAVHGNSDKPFHASFRGSFKTGLNQRREARVRYRAPFYLLWDEHSGQPMYVKGISNEVSEHGLSVEVSQMIPVNTRLSLRSESGALFGGASVKHVTKRGLIYIVGVELSYSMLDDALALVREVYSTPRAR